MREEKKLYKNLLILLDVNLQKDISKPLLHRHEFLSKQLESIEKKWMKFSIDMLNEKFTPEIKFHLQKISDEYHRFGLDRK